jgi:16S rRNA (guanine966-N2)-methyltransferase
MGRRQHKGRKGKSQQGAGQVRIIAGNWRGSRLTVPDLPGLRPTGDRVRETLFNWLAPVLPGARCLDLFAGTGALGLEAASRGAGPVLLVDNNLQAVQAIQASSDRLSGDKVTVVCADSLAWLSQCAVQFDIVFVDPPFDAGVQGQVLASLLANGVLASGARVYVESAANDQIDQPSDLRTEHDKTLGQVRLQLMRFEADGQSRRG